MGEKEIVFFISCDKNRLKIAVDDTGCGILKENQEKICQRGFSTKESDRGIGMNLVAGIVQDLLCFLYSVGDILRYSLKIFEK